LIGWARIGAGQTHDLQRQRSANKRLRTNRTKPIGLTFALIGLCLHLEQGFSGRQVQRVHMLLGQRKRTWPSFTLSRDRGDVTVIEVMRTPAGPDRDRMIDRWCASVWEAFRESHRSVNELLQQTGIIGH
jgi:hypothetical protein